MSVFMNGKQIRIKRPETIAGMDADEFILKNADPIWLHQNEMWEYIDQQQLQSEEKYKAISIDKNNEIDF